MVLHPDAQRRAQMEIDNVVGTGRLPHFGDETSLPYVSALVNEVMRWHPVAPVGTYLTYIFPMMEHLIYLLGFQRFPTVWSWTMSTKAISSPLAAS